MCYPLYIMTPKIYSAVAMITGLSLASLLCKIFELNDIDTIKTLLFTGFGGMWMLIND